MKKHILLSALSLSLATVASAQNLVFDNTFNNSAPHSDTQPGDPTEESIYSYGRMRQLNDSVFVYFANYVNYSINQLSAKVLAKTIHSDGSISEAVVVGYTESPGNGALKDYVITDLVTNGSTGTIYVIRNKPYDDNGNYRQGIHLYAFSGTNYALLQTWGNNGETAVQMPNVNLSGARASLLGTSIILGYNYGNQIATSIIGFTGAFSGLSVIVNNPGTLTSEVADVVVASSSQVYIADNASFFSSGTNSYEDAARVIKYNPSTGSLSTDYTGGGTGISVSMPWNSDNETYMIQDKISHLLYDGSKILVVGRTAENNGQAWSVRGRLTRLNTDGTVDNTFGTAGTYAPDFTSTLTAWQFLDVDLTNSNYYMISGGGNNNSSTASFLLALDATGNLLTNLGNNGFLFHDTGYSLVSDLFILGGSSTLNDKYVFNGVTSMLSTGHEETTFGRLIWSNSVQPSGLDELENTHLSVYPNPAANQLTIESLQSTNIEIITLTGTTLLSSDVHPGKNQLDISTLDAGVYLIRSANESIIRFIKQ